jgi:hypothetical protein
LILLLVISAATASAAVVTIPSRNIPQEFLSFYWSLLPLLLLL